jgi:hypothetical protein
MIQMLCKQGSDRTIITKCEAFFFFLTVTKCEVVSKRIPVPVFIVLVQNDYEIGLPSDFDDGFGS